MDKLSFLSTSAFFQPYPMARTAWNIIPKRDKNRSTAKLFAYLYTHIIACLRVILYPRSVTKLRRRPPTQQSSSPPSREEEIDRKSSAISSAFSPCDPLSRLVLLEEKKSIAANLLFFFFLLTVTIRFPCCFYVCVSNQFADTTTWLRDDRLL